MRMTFLSCSVNLFHTQTQCCNSVEIGSPWRMHCLKDLALPISPSRSNVGCIVSAVVLSKVYGRAGRYFNALRWVRWFSCKGNCLYGVLFGLLYEHFKVLNPAGKLVSFIFIVDLITGVCSGFHWWNSLVWLKRRNQCCQLLNVGVGMQEEYNKWESQHNKLLTETN
jgi:hypothetical protein